MDLIAVSVAHYQNAVFLRVLRLSSITVDLRQPPEVPEVALEALQGCRCALCAVRDRMMDAMMADLDRRILGDAAGQVPDDQLKIIGK